MKRVRSFLRRPPSERRLLLRALLLVAGVRAALWLLPYGSLRRLLIERGLDAPDRTERDLPEPDRDAAAATAEATARAVRAASRYVPRASCLTQALAAERLLAARGIDSTLRIGVARDASGAFEAHAWLEREGTVVIGGVEGLARFTPLPTPESQPGLARRL